MIAEQRNIIYFLYFLLPACVLASAQHWKWVRKDARPQPPTLSEGLMAQDRRTSLVARWLFTPQFWNMEAIFVKQQSSKITEKDISKKEKFII